MRRLAPTLAAALAAACAAPPAPGPHVRAGGRRLEVAVLAREKERRDLAGALARLPRGAGALLLWPRERYVKLESEDAPRPFDVFFLDREGRVVDRRRLEDGEREGVASARPVSGALLAPPGAVSPDAPAVEPSVEVLAAHPEELPAVRLGGAVAFVELALTEEERRRGLMFRPRMSEDDGMLFAYEGEAPRRFWMANTLIPLDIAFFSADGTLLNVVEMPTYPDPRRPPEDYATADSDGPAQYVLEVNRGWFRKKGLADGQGRPRPGLRAELPPEAVRRSFD